MGSFKLTLALLGILLLTFNLSSVSSRAFGDDDDDDGFGDLFGNSEEKSEESQEEEEAPPAARAIPLPPPPPPPPAPVAPAAPEPEQDSLQWDDESEEEDNNNNQDYEQHHNHHHNHESQQKSLNSQLEPKESSAPVPPAPQAPNQWGGVRLGFNESCNPSLDSCNTDTYLKCDSNRRVCGCINSYTYVRSQERCFPIVIGDGDCEFNDQCHAGSWGRLARCNRNTARCECYDIDGFGSREVVRVKGVCVIKKNIYDSCTNATECLSIEGAVICDFPDASVDPGRAEKQCRCDRGHIWEIRQSKCLKLATDGLASECASDDQCILSNLGELSWCSKETAKCECKDPAKPGQENVVFYKPRGKCFGKKDWNDTCREHDECRASISSKAECLPDPEGSQETTCQCPGGKICPRDVDGPDSALILTGNSGLFTITAFVGTLVYYGRL